MVLAAKAEGKVELVKPPAGASVGARVYLQGEDDVEWPVAASEIDARNKKSAWAVVSPDLKTNGEGVVVFAGKPLVVKTGPVKSNLSNAVVA